MLSANPMCNQYKDNPKKAFFQALQACQFEQAVSVMDFYGIGPNIRGGILRAPALFYVVKSGDLDPSWVEVLLRKGADPNLKNSVDNIEGETVLEEAIKTGFLYYTQLRMNHANNLQDNLLEMITLLAASGGDYRKDYFDLLATKRIFYRKDRDYTEFKDAILNAIEQGQTIFKKQEAERRLNKTPELIDLNLKPGIIFKCS